MVQRVIEEYQPIVDDLVITGNELAKLFVDGDTIDVKQVVDDIVTEFDVVKQTVRQKSTDLNDVYHGNLSDVSGQMDVKAYQDLLLS